MQTRLLCLLSAVLELDASVPLPAARRQRFARLSRRCVFGQQADVLAGVEPGARVEQQVQQACAQGHTCTQFTAEGPAAVAAAGAAEGAEAAAEVAAAQTDGEHPATYVRPTDEAASEQQGLSTACTASPSAVLPALSGEEFAVGSDAELSSDDAEEGLQEEPAPSSTGTRSGSMGLLAPHSLSRLLPAEAAAGPASEASSSSLSEAAAVRPRSVQPTAARSLLAGSSGAQAAPAAAGASVQSSSQLGQVAGMLCQLDSRLSRLAARAQQQRQDGLAEQRPGTGGVQAAVPAVAGPTPAAVASQPERLAAIAEPPRHGQPEVAATQAAPEASLAAPVLNSSLLRIQRAATLKRQVGNGTPALLGAGCRQLAGT